MGRADFVWLKDPPSLSESMPGRAKLGGVAGARRVHRAFQLGFGHLLCCLNTGDRVLLTLSNLSNRYGLSTPK